MIPRDLQGHIIAHSKQQVKKYQAAVSSALHFVPQQNKGCNISGHQNTGHKKYEQDIRNRQWPLWRRNGPFWFFSMFWGSVLFRRHWGGQMGRGAGDGPRSIARGSPHAIKPSGNSTLGGLVHLRLNKVQKPKSNL
ncbi:hypothetical protein JTE90_018101 [Oedothorax gibbosus]|uniref:Uncharacterized protein n=1 Tax=Oedothorax gibbosus TaxID=931172 RepID=A0AAV6UHC5_9ARAC|nr:hypothetical protein JTE90_018101 [Oedothorax gibbosus]